VRFAAGSFTDKGLVRELNEDAWLVDDQLTLFAVADGMGGHRGGEVASWTAIEALRAAVASGRPIRDAIERANAAVIERASRDDELEGMGTTMTAIVVNGPSSLLIGHVGDSRAYFLRDGEMDRVTEDHSLVEELVREGRLTPEQAEAHPQRAVITRALGVEPDIDVDLYTVEVDAGDRIIVCSDGLTTMLRDREIERITRNEQNPQRAAEALVDAANQAGGDDNITVVVVDVLEVDAEVTDEPHTGAAVGASVEAAPEPAKPETPSFEPPRDEPEVVAAPPRAKGSRLRTVRGAILVLVPLLLVLGLATAAVGWYARRSYYVGASGREVVIYKGVPGGVLGWDPTVDTRTGLLVSELSAVDRDRVASGAARGSLDRAQSFVARLRQAVEATSTTTTSTTRPRTSTTRPRTTTTRPRTTPRPTTPTT
jgi:PPM family protein phosphatase